MLWLLTFLLTCVAVDAQVLIDTVAGRGVRSGVSVTESGAYASGRLAWDPGGNIVFADAENGVIWRQRADGKLEIVAGIGVWGYSGDGGLANQAQVAPANPQYDGAGNLYFVDMSTRIRRVDTRGIITTVAGNGVPLVYGMELEGRATEHSILLQTSYGFAVDRTGNVYFADSSSGYGKAIRRVDPAGNLKVVAGVVTPDCRSNCSDGDGGLATLAHFTQVDRLVLDRAGNLYLMDNGRVRRLSPEGVIESFPTCPYSVIELVVDASGDVYVTCQAFFPLGLTTVQSFGPDGTLRKTFGSIALTLYTDADNRVLAAYPTNPSALVDLNSGSTVATLALEPFASSPDGTPAKDALLGHVELVAINHMGEVYFSDSASCRIRKIDSEGKLRTVAGTGKCGPQLPDLPVLPSSSSLVFDLQDRLYTGVVDRTFLVDKNGTVTEQPLRRDFGIDPNYAVDAKGRLYMMGPLYLNRLEADGTVKQIVKNPPLIGRPPPGSNYVLLDAIGTDSAGNVYFTARDSNFVPGYYRVQDDGTYSKLFDVATRPVTNRLNVDSRGRFWEGFDVTDTSGRLSVGPSYAPQSAIAPNGDVYGVVGRQIRRLTGLGVQPQPTITPGGVVNAASYAGGGIALKELLSIFGNSFGAIGLEYGQIENNRYAAELGRIRVLFNGSAGRITAATPNQINVFAPSSVGSLANVVVRVQVDDQISAPVTVPVVASAFHLFTADGSGRGPGAIVNQNGSVNSSNSAAARGSIVSLFGTGEGQTTPQIADGSLVLSKPFPSTAEPPTVSIGGQLAEVTYAGAAPFLATGVYQINVRIPVGIATGNAEVTVRFGSGTNSRPVFVAIQ